ncbi:Oidioi.mRNA.OKI2018_I69.PAR.g9508.t1.cds [Oikopleura dioica]|uniref:Oidioi.mRNA.OKI2018_I69.PAR.g9508.t1.cds n=1 Tax=Oikopleura dioica TaxID=34765 RepID=A0ABN7RNS7_OIKDI|nr:Oidioi.mRNA.OKI2018_I69.PAR.g9508.t1.cds [Oikopleura dioica]
MKVILAAFISLGSAQDDGVVAYNYDDNTYEYSYSYYDDSSSLDGDLARRKKKKKKANKNYTTPPPTTTPPTTYPPTTTTSTTTTTTTTTTTYTTDNYGAEASQYGYDSGANQNGGANGGANYGNNGGYGGDGGEDEPASNLSCWTCVATSIEDCQANGSLVSCLENEESCELEVRTRLNSESGDYFVEQIMTGCKQKLACQNNQSNNFIGKMGNFNKKKAETQCRPETDQGYDHSVCRQCCWTDNCVNADGNFWDPQTRWQWGQNNGRYGV